VKEFSVSNGHTSSAGAWWPVAVAKVIRNDEVSRSQTRLLAWSLSCNPVSRSIIRIGPWQRGHCQTIGSGLYVVAELKKRADRDVLVEPARSAISQERR
jgi:hypothetical protein